MCVLLCVYFVMGARVCVCVYAILLPDVVAVLSSVLLSGSDDVAAWKYPSSHVV